MAEDYSRKYNDDIPSTPFRYYAPEVDESPFTAALLDEIEKSTYPAGSTRVAVDYSKQTSKDDASKESNQAGFEMPF